VIQADEKEKSIQIKFGCDTVVVPS
jgi:hypothetical protein